MKCSTILVVQLGPPRRRRRRRSDPCVGGPWADPCLCRTGRVRFAGARRGWPTRAFQSECGPSAIAAVAGRCVETWVYVVAVVTSLRVTNRLSRVESGREPGLTESGTPLLL
jgi:hypothetical protein